MNRVFRPRYRIRPGSLITLLLTLLAVTVESRADDVVTTPFPGVGITRIHRTLTSPRTLNIEILIIDLSDPRIEFLVTPGDPTFRLDYTLARTTTYVTQWGLDGATNANFWSGGLGSEGDSRDCIGLALSEGWTVRPPTPAPTPPDPALLIREDATAIVGYIRSLNKTTYPRDRQGVSGVGYDGGQTGTLLVENGVNRGSTAKPATYTADPRTVAGVTQDGQTLILAAIDGRTTESGGMTLPEAADLMIGLNAWNAINLDGGGSTTMVLRYPGQSPQIINLTTGWERPVAAHLGFRIIPEYDRLTLAAAYAFGATDYTRPVYNEPTVNYTKLRQDSGSTTSIEYDSGRGYGYTSLTGLDTTPNDNSSVLDGDQIYAEHIGVKGSLGSITFRADVPNGRYRFVAAGGNVAEYNHVSKIRVRSGGGLWVNMLDHEHVNHWTIWRVAFGDKQVPPADGSGHDSGATTDPMFQPLVNSPVITVTSGYLEFQQIGRGVNSTDLWGGDLCLLEIWQLEKDEPDIDVDPLDIDFGPWPKNHTTDPVQIVVRNTGAADLTYSAALTGTGADQFEFVGDTGATVAPDAQDTLDLRFAPDHTGSIAAQVHITSDDPDEPLVVVHVYGDGLSDPPPDLDDDGDVDLSDYGDFLSCYNGPNLPPPVPACDVADFDFDGDVDLTDYGTFLACYNGPAAPAPPGCAGY
jgi:hypothetical protein